MSKNEVASNMVSHMVEILENIGDKLNYTTYNNNIKDFKKDDIVVCSLLKGIYRVYDINVDSERISLIHVVDKTHIPIKCKYVKKLDNSTASKVLFNK